MGAAVLTALFLEVAGGNDDDGNQELTGLFGPLAVATPHSKAKVAAAFVKPNSIPLSYVFDGSPEARYEAHEFQAGDDGYVRLRMVIKNRGLRDLQLGAAAAYGILSNGEGFHFSGYAGVTLEGPNDGLPESLPPGQTWEGWVYLQSVPPGFVFFSDGSAEFILEISSRDRLGRFRHYIKLW